MLYLLTWKTTGDPHWKEMYLRCREEALTKTLDHVPLSGPTYAGLQLQFSVRLVYDLDDANNNIHPTLNKDYILYLDPNGYQEIMDYLEGNLGEDVDMDALAERFYISKYHMMRLFRRETGTTIHLYITQKRLVKARELIDSGMRATEACYRCGWRSYSSFTRAYGKYFGTTPTGRADAHLVRAEAPE